MSAVLRDAAPVEAAPVGPGLREPAPMDAVLVGPARHDRPGAPVDPASARVAATATTIAMWLTFGAIVVWRTALLAQQGGPVGVDMGNWLRLFRTLPLLSSLGRSGDAMAGGIDVDDVIVPPLVPLIAGLASLTIGPLWASWVVPAIASIAPGVGVWLVVSRSAPTPRGATVATTRARPGIVSGIVAAGAALAVTLVHPTATAFAWGGVPQLLGLGIAPVAIAAAAHAASDPSRRAWLRAGLLATAVAMTSTLVTALLAVALVATVGFAAAEQGRRVLRGIGWALLAGVPAIALYVPILSRMTLYAERSTRITGEQAFLATVGEPAVLWLLLVVITAITPLVLPAGRSRTLSVGLGAAGITGLWIGDVRFAALLPVVAAIAVALLIGHAARSQTERWTLRRSATATLAGIAALLLVSVASIGVRGQAEQVDFYAQLVPPGLLDDAQRIAALDRGGNAVAVVPLSGAPTGWWLEAVGVDALVASRPDWLAFPEERRRAARAVALFTAPTWPTPRTATEACALGAGWLYIPTVWQGLDEEALDREISAGRLIEVLQTPTARVIRASAC